MKRQQDKVIPVIRNLFKNVHYPAYRYALITLVMIAGAIGGVYLSVTIGNSVQTVAEGGKFAFSNVLLPLIIAAGIQLSAEYFRVLLVEKYSAEIGRQFRNLTFRRLLGSKQSWLEEQKTGDLINKSGESLFSAVNLLTGSLPGSFNTVISMGIMIIYLVINNWMLALLYFILFPFVIYMQNAFSRPINSTMTNRLEASGKCNNIAVDALRNLRTVKSYGLENILLERYGEKGIILQEKFRKFYWMKSIVCFVGQAVSIIPTVLVCVGAIYFVSKGQLELGSLLAFMLVMLRLNNPLRNFSRLMADVRGNIAGALRTIELWNSPQEDRSKTINTIDKENEVIRFDNVSFSYNKIDPIIKNVNFSINEGENIAIVGESGCGKSTLLKLISGLYEADKGDITVLGHKIFNWNLMALRGNISYVPQSNDLFPVSLHENITWGCNEFTEKSVKNACRTAGILKHIESLPDGFETLAGERGIRLSGGQRQRIAIARAILRNSDLVLLDEATSSLDSITERDVQKSLNELTKGKTTITVSHRLSSIRNADKIYVIHDGSIAETGSHEKLIADKGIYHRLYKRQQENRNEK